MNLKSGSTGWSELSMLEILSEGAEGVDVTIIRDVRFPALITAMLAGAGLSVSGLLMQVLFQNALAGPGVMGVSSGASLAVSISMLAGFGHGLGHTAFAIFGSMLVLAIIILAALRLKSHAGLLILGLMLGYIISSLVSILQLSAEANRLQQFIFWTMGGFHGVSWSGIVQMAPWIIAVLCMTFVFRDRLDILLLGEVQMKTLGYDPRRWRVVVLAVTGILVGVVTAYCGPLAFLGLAAPHIARLFTDTDVHNKMIPMTIFTGIIISLLALWIVNAPWLELQLPLNAVLSIFGAPVVIWLLIRSPHTLDHS